MATASDAMIADVEEALRRLLEPSTPAPEKAQLEAQLSAFKAQIETCLPVLYSLLGASTNEYALWFASTTLEEYVATRWRAFPAAEKLRLRRFVWDLVLARSDQVRVATQPLQTAFVLRKLRKVLADIARLDWTVDAPGDDDDGGGGVGANGDLHSFSNDSVASNASSVHSAGSSGSAGNSSNSAQWPEFLSQVEALVIEAPTRLCGLELLVVVAEEFGREDAIVVASRRRRVRRQLAAQLPSLLSLLSSILRGALEQILAQEDALGEQDRVARLALDALLHLLAWAPMSESLHSTPWLSLLFDLAGCWHAAHARGGHAARHLDGASRTALQCITELLSKRLPVGRVEEAVAQIMLRLCTLLQRVHEVPASQDVLTEAYLDQLTALVEAFLTQHLRRLENPQFEAVLPQFLELVMSLTARQPHVSGFLNCLSVWEVFVGYIEEAEQNDAASNSRVRQLLGAYEHGLTGVMFHLLDRVNYATNQSQLEELEDEENEQAQASTGNPDDDPSAFDVDSDTTSGRFLSGSLQDLAQWYAAHGSGSDDTSVNVELSDYKEFIVECIALIRRIAALPSCAPALMERVVPKVSDTCQQLVFRLHESPALPPGTSAWTEERYAVRDLTVNCAILSSVCAQYCCVSSNPADQLAAWRLLHQFTALAEYVTRHRLHTRGDVFVGLQCEALTCIRFCLTCVPFVLTQPGTRGDVLEATEGILQVLLTTLDTTIVPSPHIVMQSAMQLLANLGYVLPYDEMVSLPSMSQLETHIHGFSQHLPLTIQGDLYTSMSNSILNSAISLRSSGAASDEAMQRWANAYGALILPLRESIDQSAIAVQQNDGRILDRAMISQIQRDCFIVRSLARSVETKPKIAKDGFCSAYQPSFASLLALMTTYFSAIKKAALSYEELQPRVPVYNALKVVNEIVRLYAQLLKSIRKEMPKEMVTEIMRIFVEIFQDAQLSAILSAQGTPGLMVLCGFLQLLKIVVEEPTAVFASFLKDILDLCFGPLKEAIFDHAESEAVILGYFVSLVEQLLEKHYRFFVAPATNLSRERAFSSDVARNYFVSIFQSLAAVLTSQSSQADSQAEQRGNSGLSPRLCRQVLALLDRIDRAHSLFAFSGFQSEIRLGLLSTLMTILTKGEMNLLQDEVIALIYRLAAVDFQSFFTVFLPAFTKDILTPSDVEVAASYDDGECLQWSGQVDLPTFTRDVHAYLNDLRAIKAQA
ncbi:hypothetical protein PINS_up012516 [Pythium insidiosum]|nr:hypothetical protein PINS_up012516 [Pythium insidiosum]